MSERSNKVLLIDMLEAAEKVVRHMQGVDLTAFLADENLRDAIVYRLQIIGEAAYKVSDPLKVTPGDRLVQDPRTASSHRA